MKKQSKNLPSVNEKFYTMHMMKQMEIEKRQELVNTIALGFPPMQQRMEKEFEWERITQR